MEKLSWGREPLAQALVISGGRDQPGLRPSLGEGPLLRKASQAEGAPPRSRSGLSAFIGEEKQEDQVWDGKLMTFIASTGAPDRNGNVLDVAGWELDNYRANPVVLFNHNWDLPPVGKAISIGIEGQVLKATVQFAPTQLGQELALLNADGYLRAISVGARPLEWEIRRHPEHGFPIGIHCHKQELIELSIVPVPANPNTLHASFDVPPWEPALITGILKDPEERQRIGLTHEQAAAQPDPNGVGATWEEILTLLQRIYAHLRG